VRDDRERLADVLAAIDRIRRYVQDDRTRFDTDELLQSAVLHWIEIIGEAARGVGDKVRTAHPEVPWRVITDMRNRVSHGYFDIDLDVVWNTVSYARVALCKEPAEVAVRSTCTDRSRRPRRPALATGFA
jgi:uncharacterized protein with HEPN domain